MGQAQTKSMIKKKRVHKFDSKEEYFIKNGSILLEKQIALTQGKDIGAGQLKVLSQREIKKATNNYDPDLIVRRFRGGTTYKATLDDRTVVIKAPQDPVAPNTELIDRFLTEASVGMVFYNNLTAKLYGCCLETYIPMPVYEYFPNQDLHHYLHGEYAVKRQMKWTDRLRIATDIAYALSYMHNALSKPVVHRDVMSFSVLIGSSYHAKLVNFGYSVSIDPGNKDQTWPVQGTLGYIDPECIETQQVTEKCDVYSFGVLMLELLTGKEPTAMARSGTELVDVFVSAVGRNCMNEMIDSKVSEHGNLDEINLFARLALTCVAKKGEDRPTMIDVVKELQLIQDQDSKRS